MPKLFKSALIITFILIAVALIPFSTQAQENPRYTYKEFEPFKMAFIPDAHLSFKDKDDWILYKESFVVFQDVMKQINKMNDLDFVVFGGDFTNNDNGDFSNLPMFLDTIAELKPDYYAILGDREADVADKFTKEDFTQEFEEFKLKQTFWKTEPVKDVLLIGLDTSVNNKQAGYINLHQLFWLDSILRNNSEKFTIITMHHPPLVMNEEDLNSWENFTLKKPDLFLEIINLYPQVKIVLSGHHHNNFAKRINEKLFINCPSIATYPNIYKILEIYPDKIKVENQKISFKQIIKKAKNNLIKSDYAKEFNPQKPKAVINFQKGDKFSRQDEYYFIEPKKKFLFW